MIRMSVLNKPKGWELVKLFELNFGGKLNGENKLNISSCYSLRSNETAF
jgi:hypothetical protein